MSSEVAESVRMMSDFRPANEAHALVSVAFTVHFDAPVDLDLARQVDDAVKASMTGVFHRRQAHMLPMGGPLIPMPFTPAVLVFDSVAPNGTITRGLKLQDNLATYLLGDYDRWATSWPKVAEALTVVLRAVGSQRRVIMLSAQYVDHFIASIARETTDAREVLRRESRLLPAHVFERRENWHAHTGFFDLPVHRLTSRVLNRVNVDVVDSEQAPAKLLRITLQHFAYCDGVAVSELIEGDFSTFGQIFSGIHDLDKRILRDLINDEMCDRIKLGRPSST